jgi:hypothetical protein
MAGVTHSVWWMRAKEKSSGTVHRQIKITKRGPSRVC